MSRFRLCDDIVFPRDDVYAMLVQPFREEDYLVIAGTIVRIVEGDIEVDESVYVEELETYDPFDIPVHPFLKELPWFHGDVTREEAEKKLISDRCVFLIRTIEGKFGRRIDSVQRAEK